ncbi:MAG TPA: acyltransferase [Candidatus Obscuribacterales bacterium]
MAERKYFQIDALDGLRGFAALIVLLSHTSNNGSHLIPWLDCAGTGKSGVYLFFILSSFLLTYPLLAPKQAQFRSDNLMRYAARRFFRIYPLLFVYLSVALLTSFMVLQHWCPVALPFSLTIPEFAKSILMQEGKSVTWSIPVEFTYYFFLPLVAYIFSRVLGNRLIPGLLFVTAAVAVDLIWRSTVAVSGNSCSLGPFLPAFLIGSFLAVCQTKWHEQSSSWQMKFKGVVEAVGIICSLTAFCLIPSVASALVGHIDPLEDVRRQLIPFSVLWCGVLFAAANGTGLIRSAFELPMMRYLGRISYSFYLMHPVCIYLVSAYAHVGNGCISAWLILIATVAVSSLTYVMIEKPFLSLRFKGPAVKATMRDTVRDTDDEVVALVR